MRRKKASSTVVQSTLFGDKLPAVNKPEKSSKTRKTDQSTKRSRSNDNIISICTDGCNDFDHVTAKRVKQKTTSTALDNQSTLNGFASKQENQTDSRTLEKHCKSTRQTNLNFLKNNLVLAQPLCLASDVPKSELKARAKMAMQCIFGIEKLRNLQPKAVSCALQRQSQIIIMSTGGGKSLCYQLPAVVLGGVTVVVSPLIALMQDQVSGLIDRGISAAVISSSNTEKQNLEILERLLGRSLRDMKGKSFVPLPHITVLYVTPEQIQTNRFRDVLMELHGKNRLSLFAIDEAHWYVCLQKFRPFIVLTSKLTTLQFIQLGT
jgi:ATP-dependent helicase YprA (DUF1998 family)